MRGRSYSYSPSPPRGYSRYGRSPSTRGRCGGSGRDLTTSLLVRNLRRDCRPEDLCRPFGEFGPLKDVYLPRDYYTGEPRGFGFVQYLDPDDAAEAKYQIDGQIILGREITVVSAEENRKKPSEMRARERYRGRVDDRDSRSPHYSRGYSRGSASPYCSRGYSPSPGYCSPSSISPQDTRYGRRSHSRSPYGSRSRSQSPAKVQEQEQQQELDSKPYSEQGGLSCGNVRLRDIPD